MISIRFSLRMISLLAIGSMINGVDSNAVTCPKLSTQCCNVVNMWLRMGKTLTKQQLNQLNANGLSGCCQNVEGVVFRTIWPIPAVSCDIKGTIRKINWGGQSLTGTIPKEIGSLTSLEYLTIAGNPKLTGTIPTEIGSLTKLKKLYLSGNALSGSIPTTIGNLIQLTQLGLNGNQLTGGIPPQIGNLLALQRLYLSQNQLSGELPAAMIEQKLKNLAQLVANDNTGLYGKFTPRCGTQVALSNTNVTLCGCASEISPPSVFPPEGTPDVCRASGPATSLEKRTHVFSLTIGAFKYGCNVDAQKNPFQDCLNAMSKICDPTYMKTDATLVKICKTSVNAMVRNMSIYWQDVRRACGQWPWDEHIGSSTSLHCTSANLALQQNSHYLVWNGLTGWTRVPVPFSLTESVRVGLWGNSQLKG